MTLIVVAVVTVVNALLALHDLTVRSLWADEGASWLISSQHGGSLLHALAHEGGDMLVYYLLLHAVVALLGHSVFVLRMPSLILGALAVPVLYYLGREITGTRVGGIVASVFLGVSQPLIYWEQNARAYSLDVLLASASTLAFFFAVKKGGVRAFLVWSVLTAVGCLAHPLMVLLVGAQLVALVFIPQSRRLVSDVLLGLGAIGLLDAPLAVLAIERGTNQIAWLARPNASMTREVAIFLASGAPTADATAARILAFASLGCVVVAVILLVVDLRQGRTVRTFGSGLVLSALVLPPVAAWGTSFLVQPVFLDRYLVICLPAAAVCGALVLTRIPTSYAGAGVLVAIVLLRLAIVSGGYGSPIDDDVGATAYVVAHTVPGDCVAFYPNDQRLLYDYYTANVPPRALPRQVLPTAASHETPAAMERLINLASAQVSQLLTTAHVELETSACHRLWLYVSHAGRPDGTAPQRANFAGLVAVQQVFGGLFTTGPPVSFSGVQLQLYMRAVSGH